MNPHADWRIDFGRRIAGRLIPFEGIKAIVIAGSVARGYADQYSDIEIPIFWETLPEDTTRYAIVQALHADFLYAYDGPAREDQILINGLQVDLWHITTTHEEDVINGVLYECHSDAGSLNALDTIRNCIPLYGDEIVQGWKLRAQAYPDELAKQVIQEHMASFSMGELFILAQRNNPTAFHARLSHIQQEVFLVLLALNKAYFPTFKWLYHALESMQVKPKDIGLRFRQAFEISHAEAIADTKLMLEETLHLVEKQYPQIDTTRIYRHLNYIRAVHETPLTPFVP